MALVTTIGASDADSFIDEPTYLAYWHARGVEIPGTVDVQEAHLRRSAQWMSTQLDWLGTRQYERQALSWPRVVWDLVRGWWVPTDSVPVDVRHAQAEFAWKFQQGDDPWNTVVDGAVRRRTVRAGPVESVEDFLDYTAHPRFDAINRMISPYLATGRGQIRLRRG